MFLEVTSLVFLEVTSLVFLEVTSLVFLEVTSLVSLEVTSLVSSEVTSLGAMLTAPTTMTAPTTVTAHPCCLAGRADGHHDRQCAEGDETSTTCKVLHVNTSFLFPLY